MKSFSFKLLILLVLISFVSCSVFGYECNSDNLDTISYKTENPSLLGKGDFCVLQQTLATDIHNVHEGCINNGYSESDFVIYGGANDWGTAGKCDQSSALKRGYCYNHDKPSNNYDVCTSTTSVDECYLIGDYWYTDDDDYEEVSCPSGTVCSYGYCKIPSEWYTANLITNPNYTYVSGSAIGFPNWMWSVTYKPHPLGNGTNLSEKYANTEGDENYFFVYNDPSKGYLLPSVPLIPSVYLIETYAYVNETVTGNFVVNTLAGNPVSVFVQHIDNEKGIDYSGTKSTSNFKLAKGLNHIQVYLSQDNYTDEYYNFSINYSVLNKILWINSDNANEAGYCDDGLDNDKDGKIDMFDSDCNQYIDCSDPPSGSAGAGCCGDDIDDYGKYVTAGIEATRFVCLIDENNVSKWTDAGSFPDMVVNVTRDSREKGFYQLYSNGIDWYICDKDNNRGTFSGPILDESDGLLCYLNDLDPNQEKIAVCNDLSDRIIKVDGLGTIDSSMTFANSGSKYEWHSLSSSNWPVYDFVEFDIKFVDSDKLNMYINGANQQIRVINYTTGPASYPSFGEWRHVKIPISGLIDKNVTKIIFFIPPAEFGQGSPPVNVEIANYFYLTKNGEKQYCAPGNNTLIWVDDLDNAVPVGTDDACAAHSESFKWTGSKCCGDDLSKENYYADNVSGCWDSINVQEGELVNATY